MSRRGFALPMVILLTVVVGVTAAVLLERQTAQRLGARRMIDAYQEHHAGVGIRELLDTWLRTRAAVPLREMLGPDGHIMDVTLRDGSVLSIRLEDAQGSLLAGPAPSAQDQETAEGMIRSARSAMGEPTPDRPEWWRRHGPVAVSVRSAPEPVLRAVLGFSLEGEGVEQALREVLSARDRDEPIERQLLTEIADGAGASREQRALLLSLLTDDPSLWRATLELRNSKRGRTGSRVVARYEGLVLTQREAGGADDSLRVGSSFLSWRDLGIEDEPGR